jgi:AcrR family transcriptional regulator
MDAGKGSSTREKLVQAARELFWERGYAATGLADILARAGVRGGSLYYFFKTKEELLRAVLQQYITLLDPVVIDPAFATNEDPIERVFAVLAGYRAGLVMTGCRHGCPIARIALDATEASDATRGLVALNFDNWARAIEAALEKAGDRLPPDMDREALARFVLVVMEGAVMQAQTHRDLGRFDAAVRVLRDYFNRLVEAGVGDSKVDSRAKQSHQKG